MVIELGFEIQKRERVREKGHGRKRRKETKKERREKKKEERKRKREMN